MVTIKDIAREAGVSVGTVSNVLNGKRVGEVRRRRVEQVIEKLGYQTGTLVRDSGNAAQELIVILLPNVTNPFFAELLEALDKELTVKGLMSLLCLSDRDVEKEKKILDMVQNKQVGGIIGVTYSRIEEYLSEDIPMVAIERHFPDVGIPCVASDSYYGGELAAQKLYECGARNLLCVQMVSAGDNEVHRRKIGFEHYCMANQINYGSVEFSDKQVPSVYSAFESENLVEHVLRGYIDNAPDHQPVDGIFAGADHLAVMVTEVLRNMGKKVPEEVQVIGFDGIRLMNQGNYLVSTISQNIPEIARVSVECLQKRMNQEPVEDHINLPVTYISSWTTRDSQQQARAEQPV